MTCDDLRRWVEGADEGARPDGYREHLGRCSSCRSEWPELLALGAAQDAVEGAVPSFVPPRRGPSVPVLVGLGLTAAAPLLFALLPADPPVAPTPEAKLQHNVAEEAIPPLSLPASGGEMNHSRALVSQSAGQRIVSRIEWTHVTPTLPAWARSRKP